MKFRTTSVKVISIELRELPSTKAGEAPTTFVTFHCFDGSKNHKLWAFLDDFPSLPNEGESGVFETVIRAKVGNFGPYVSIRATNFTLDKQ